jgi:hypothetical protein
VLLLHPLAVGFGGAEEDAEARAVGFHQALHKGRVGNATPMIVFRRCTLPVIWLVRKNEKINLGRSIAKQGFQLLPAGALRTDGDEGVKSTFMAWLPVLRASQAANRREM